MSELAVDTCCAIRSYFLLYKDASHGILNPRYHFTSLSQSGIDTESDEIVNMLPCDPGCHRVNFGAKAGGGYYAYVSSTFSNELIVVDGDPNNNGDSSADAAIAGRVSLVSSNTQTDDKIVGLEGTGGQGILAIPNVYNGWVQNIPSIWKDILTEEQQNPITN